MLIIDLFEPEPRNWGLRGDPYMWRSLSEYFDGTLTPATSEEFEKMLRLAFQKITGHNVDHDQPVLVNAFAHGGISSGHVDPEFWRNQGFPILLERLARMSQSKPCSSMHKNSGMEITPGEASASSIVIMLNHPYGGVRPAAHLFDLTDGGIAWVDHGWTDPLASSHVVHFLEGKVLAEGPNRWLLKTARGEKVAIWPDPDGNRPDGDRDTARAAIVREFSLNLIPSP